MQASDDAEGAKTGNTTVVGGLGVQIIAFGFFVAMTVVWHVRMQKEPTNTALRVGENWRRYVWLLYVVSGLVIVRSVFRLADFIEGSEGTAYNTEALLYVFDAGLMFLVVVGMAVVHPGLLLRGIRKGGSALLDGEENDNGGFLLRKTLER